MNFIKIQDKSADSKLLSIWWFAVLVVIGVGIVSGTLIFFSEKIDVRLFESKILAERTAECLVSNGYLNNGFLESNFDIFKTCSLSQVIVDKSTNYFLKISVYDSANNLVGTPIVYGNTAFEKECPIGAAMKYATSFPRCYEKKMQVLGVDNKKLMLDIIAGSNQEYKLGAGK